MNIYVASSWRNARQPSVVEALRDAGHKVYDFRNPPSQAGFGWEQINDKWQYWDLDEYLEALDHPLAQAGFESDFNAMKDADCCVLVLPSGRSSHLEAGWFAGVGKLLVILLDEDNPIEPELMNKMADAMATKIVDVIWFLNEPRNQPVIGNIRQPPVETIEGEHV